jgi:hypothetical protein
MAVKCHDYEVDSMTLDLVNSDTARYQRCRSSGNVTFTRTRRQKELDASKAPLDYYHDRVQHRYRQSTKSCLLRTHCL